MAKSRTISGRMILSNEIPAAFMASNSKRSPKLPNVIKEANNTAKGSDIGTRLNAE